MTTVGITDDEIISALYDTAREMDSDVPAREMANIIYNTCRTLALACGQNPMTEVFIRSPGKDYNSPNAYVVSWEAGPHDWAVPVSMAFKKLVEPHYGFDLSFYPSED
jgi:hypothetical protein